MCFYTPVGSSMSSSFSSASSFSLFSFTYAFVAASLFSASFGHILKTLDGIFSSFWQPLGTLGATLGAIGHHLGNHVDPRLKIGSSYGAPGQLRFQFGVPFGAVFEPKLNNFFENLLPKTIPQPNAWFIRFLCNFSDTRTLIFELPPARERNSQKNT